MIVSRTHVMNALNMTLDDYVCNDDHISADELIQVERRFRNLMDELIEDCENPENEDEDEDEMSEDKA